ncbi:MAG: hypothetical protein ACHQ4H_06265 [Ktedonobacterales bacterium]
MAPPNGKPRRDGDDVRPASHQDTPAASATESPPQARRAPLDRALLAAATVLLIAVLLAVVVSRGAGGATGRTTNASLATLPPATGPSGTAVPQVAAGTGWTASGPAWAQTIVFAPIAPTTAYICGAPGLASTDQPTPVPVMVGISHDAGTTWQTVTTPATSVSCMLTVDPTDATDLLLDVVPCFRCAAATPHSLYRSYDGGRDWTRIPVPVTAPSGTGAGIYAGIGSWGWAGSTLYLMPYVAGQTAWTQLIESVASGPFVSVPHVEFLAGLPANVALNTIYGAPGVVILEFDAGIGCDQNCTVLRWSNNDGSPWVTYAPTYNGAPVSLVGGESDSSALYGETDQGGTHQRTYVISRDVGSLWSPLPPVPLNMVGDQFVGAPDGTLYMLMRAMQGISPVPDGIFELAPGATSWTWHAALPPGGTLHLSCDAAGHPLRLWADAHGDGFTMGLVTYAA